jgi:mRNA-degrading endonuclease RelE of RelBE toxin-antitoxin system
MKLTFVETCVFSDRWNRRLDYEQLRVMQNELLEDPARGDPIPGCSILRKLRFGDESRGKGKRGGVRVIYVHTPEASRIDLVTVYGKDEADDLTKDQVKVLCRLAVILRGEAKAGAKRAGSPRAGIKRKE